MVMRTVFLLVLLTGNVQVTAAPQALSALRSGKVASWLQKAWQQPALQKLSATLLVGGMLTLPMPALAAQEQVAVQAQVAPQVQSSTVDDWADDWDAARALLSELQELEFVPEADARWQAVTKKLRSGDIDINATDGGGNTILMRAVRSSWYDWKPVELLVHYGADVNLANGGGYTALMEASKKGREKGVALLLRGGAAINAVNLYGDNALMVALQSEDYRTGGFRVAEQLLEHDGIAVNITNHDGNTPLMLTVLMGDLKLVTSLLEKGARVDITNKKGETALTLALKLEHSEISDLLYNRGEIEAEVAARNWEEPDRDDYSEAGWSDREFSYYVYETYDDLIWPLVASALKKASVQHKLEIVASILDRIVGSDAVADEFLGEALHAAAIRGNTAVVKTLLQHPSVDVDYAASDNSTALTLAASRGHAKIVELLLLSGAEINIVNSYAQQTALMFAAEGGHYETVRLLLRYGAEVNAQDEAAGTALVNAVLGQHYSIIEMLLENDADHSLEFWWLEEELRTPLMSAALAGDVHSTRLLMRYGAKFTKEQRKNVDADDFSKIMKTIHAAWAL